MGDVGEAAVAVTAAVVAGVAALRWARRRCDEALAAARRLPPLPGRTLVLVAKADPGPVSGARAREVRALQQALDGGWRGGAP